MTKPKYEPPVSDEIIKIAPFERFSILFSKTSAYLLDQRTATPQIEAEMPGDKNNASKI